MNDVIVDLYATFVHYRLGNDFAGCDCCVDPGHSLRLTASPLRELTFNDLEHYSRKAMSTWGTARHFKHFLPSLLELTIEYRDDFLDLPPVFGKLADAQWESWSDRERRIVTRFFNDYWRHQLAEPIVGSFEDAIDTVLCALASACSSVQPFLDAWLRTDTDDAKRHLAAFILSNDGALIKNARLSNPFWDTKGGQHQEVVNWLQSQADLEYLADVKDTVLVDDFAYAWPQLMAIRLSLGTR